MKKTLRLLVVAAVTVLPGALFWLVSFCMATSCAAAMPIVRSVEDLARAYCVLVTGEHKQGMSAEDVQKQFCATDEQLHPFVQAILASKAGLEREIADAGAADGDSGTLTVYVLVSLPADAARADGSAE